MELDESGRRGVGTARDSSMPGATTDSGSAAGEDHGQRPWSLRTDGGADLVLKLSGDFDLTLAAELDAGEALRMIREARPRRLGFDAAALRRWDSLLMSFLKEVVEACRSSGIEVDDGGLPEGIRSLLRLASAVPDRADARRTRRRVGWVETLGRKARELSADVIAFTGFLGEVSLALLALLTGRARFREIDIWLNIQACGPAAVPIVTLISVLVGLILAFVGAVQLALFGAEIYIADLVALGMTREMGALMTAIIMSGRTGAAFAAQLGTMNVNMEIPALRVMGLAPMEFLVLPRMLALILTMPLLCLYADLMGIIGGGVISISFFDLSLTQYLERAKGAVQVADLLVGLTKCWVFGVVIAISGCLRGMQCGRSASAVGDAATSAVVTSIVLIVVSDSIITLICDRLGI